MSSDKLTELTSVINNSFMVGAITEDQAIGMAIRLLQDYRALIKLNINADRDRVIDMINYAFHKRPMHQQPLLITPNNKEKIINLVFITPKIAERYKELLNLISERTGWSIETNSTKVNQAQCFTIIKHLLQGNRVDTIKATQYNQQYKRFIVHPKYLLHTNTEEKLQRLFEESTGLELEFIYQKKLVDERQRQIVIGRMMAIAEGS